MPKKKQHSGGGFVFSTDPGFQFPVDRDEEQTTLPLAEQKLKVRLDNKQRAGKMVTLVEYFIGKQHDLNELGKKLKTYCGTGGSVKDGEIIIQGDNREKIMQWLLSNGYTGAKKS